MKLPHDGGVSLRQAKQHLIDLLVVFDPLNIPIRPSGSRAVD